MPRALIHAGNYFWLVVVLVGVPSITGVQWGAINVSATTKFQMLTLCGLGIGAAINLLYGWRRGGKQRRVGLKWAIAYGAILFPFYLVFSGYIHFRWLKDTLVWLKNIVS